MAQEHALAKHAQTEIIMDAHPEATAALAEAALLNQLMALPVPRAAVQITNVLQEIVQMAVLQFAAIQDTDAAVLMAIVLQTHSVSRTIASLLIRSGRTTSRR